MARHAPAGLAPSCRSICKAGCSPIAIYEGTICDLLQSATLREQRILVGTLNSSHLALVAPSWVQWNELEYSAVFSGRIRLFSHRKWNNRPPGVRYTANDTVQQRNTASIGPSFRPVHETRWIVRRSLRKTIATWRYTLHYCPIVCTRLLTSGTSVRLRSASQIFCPTDGLRMNMTKIKWVVHTCVSLLECNESFNLLHQHASLQATNV